MKNVNNAPRELSRTVLAPARILLGWTTDEQAQLLQSEHRIDRIEPQFLARAKAARSAVAQRAAFRPGPQTITAPPASLSEYQEQLKLSPALKPFWDEGWRLVMADLRSVVAIQPHVFSAHATERVEQIAANDLNAIAKVSVPIGESRPIPAQFDQDKHAWMILSQNRNLRVTGNWGGPVRPGVVGFGFSVEFLPSFMQVVELNGRCFLRDGYHRALGMLQRGVTTFPVIYKAFKRQEEIGLVPGLLPNEAIFSDRPPVIPDYLSDDVSLTVTLPIVQRTIIIQALELSPFS